MDSLLAGWRVSLHRTRADWPIVGAALLITLLAAVLLSAGPIYSSATSVAGLRRTLADSATADANIVVSVYSPPAAAAAFDDDVRSELQRVIEPVGGSIDRDLRGSATLALPARGGGGKRDQAILGALDGLPDHATLLAGAWPADAGNDAESPIQVVVLDAVAQELGLAVGDQLTLTTHHFDLLVAVPVRLVGIFTINAVNDPYWYDDEQLLTGVANGSSRTFGPFITTPDDLLAHAGVDSVHVQWRIFPNLDRLTVEGSTVVRARLATLPERVGAVTAEPVQVRTGLTAILGEAERSLVVSRAGVLLLMVQLGILAAYAIILTASLLVDHRRIDTALLRSRGAAPWQVAMLALAEGLLLAVPAVVVAPWVTVGALNLLNVVGPLADVGLEIVPRVSMDGYLAAAAAGIVCVGLLVLPALLGARGFAAEQGELSRQETRTFGQRMGIDVALLALTGIAVWQLRLYGAPLTRTVQGRLGLDPLLVAAPAIGLLAGGVLALRILPLLAVVAEASISRGRKLVASLGSRQLARRPLRYTRSALLLMLAISMGIFALSYAATWSTSQRDQAAYQAGADIRAQPGHTRDSLPPWAVASAYSGIPGVERASPVERIGDGVSVATGSGDLLAIDADSAADVVLFRADESATSIGALMGALRDGRPRTALVNVPPDAGYLRIVPRLDTGQIGMLVIDPDTHEAHLEPIDPALLGDIRVSASAVVRDGHGLLYRLDSPLVPINGAGPGIVLPLEPTDEQSGGAVARVAARLDGPVELAALGISVLLPTDAAMTGGLIGVAAISAAVGADGPWTDLPLASVGTWAAKMAPGRQVLANVPAGQVQGTTVRLAGDGPGGAIFSMGSGAPDAQISFIPAALASLGEPVPVIANRAFLADTSTSPGDTVTTTIDGALRTLTIAGVVDAFPTTDPARPLIVIDDETLGLLRLQATGGTRSPDEWWIAAADGATGAIAAALRASPFDSAPVVSVEERARSLTADPVALGIVGALALGFVVTGIFAIVGLTVSAAVSARQRRTEFALLRALGLSRGQLAGWLWLESASLVGVSLLAGTGLGLLIGWMVLPYVTVTQSATAPVPPVIIEVPWDRIGLLETLSVVALGVSVVVIVQVLRRLGVGSVLRMGED